MKHEMLFSGIGGQGIMMLGETLVDAAVEAGYEATFVPFYGQEKRGGRTMCHVVVSDEMGSPIISKAEIMLFMDERSYTEFEDLAAEDGTVIINSSLIDREPKRNDYKLTKVPFHDIATKELGNAKTANMVALGAVTKYLSFLSLDQIKAAVEKSFEKKPKLIPLNLEAVQKGYDSID